MSDTIHIEAGQQWSSPTGIVVTITIVRPAEGFDDSWVVTGSNSAACLSTDYILENYWLMERVPASPS